MARRDRVEVATVGVVDVEGTAPMARDSIFRIASITESIIAAAVMMLVDDGRIALGDTVEKWLPELAPPVVVRTPDGPVDDVVPAARPITVADLLTFRAGYGLQADFSLPAVQMLFDELQKDMRSTMPDEWMSRLARIPMLHQPGEAWLYNTCSDKLGRLTSYYNSTADGLELVAEPAGTWSTSPAFPSGGGGLVSTADDVLAFGRMLIGEETGDGRRLLSPESVRQMTTDHLTPAQREASMLFLEGQGWGFGGSVDIATIEARNVQGRYGWVGGTGTAAHM